MLQPRGQIVPKIAVYTTVHNHCWLKLISSHVMFNFTCCTIHFRVMVCSTSSLTATFLPFPLVPVHPWSNQPKLMSRSG